MQRITAYIRQVFGEEVLAEIVSQKRTVSLNGIILDATAKNFRDKRVTPTSKVEVSTPTSSALDSIRETTEIPVVETTEVPVVESPRKVKRHYARLKIDKSIPEGAIVHTSKNGRQFYVKVIGKKEYI